MDDTDELTAERILKERFNEDHHLQFLIKWTGEDEEDATWESYDEVISSWSHLLKQFNSTLIDSYSNRILIDIADDDDEDDDVVHDEDDYYRHPRHTQLRRIKLHHRREVNDVPSHSSTSTISTLTHTLSPNRRQSRSSSVATNYTHSSSITRSLPQYRPQSILKQPQVRIPNVCIKPEPIRKQQQLKQEKQPITNKKSVVTKVKIHSINNHVRPTPIIQRPSIKQQIMQSVTSEATQINKSTHLSPTKTTLNTTNDASKNNTSTTLASIPTSENISKKTHDATTTTTTEISEIKKLYRPTLQLDFGVSVNEISQTQKDQKKGENESENKQNENENDESKKESTKEIESNNDKIDTNIEVDKNENKECDDLLTKKCNDKILQNEIKKIWQNVENNKEKSKSPEIEVETKEKDKTDCQQKSSENITKAKVPQIVDKVDTNKNAKNSNQENAKNEKGQKSESIQKDKIENTNAQNMQNIDPPKKSASPMINDKDNDQAMTESTESIAHCKEISPIPSAPIIVPNKEKPKNVPNDAKNHENEEAKQNDKTDSNEINVDVNMDNCEKRINHRTVSKIRAKKSIKIPPNCNEAQINKQIESDIHKLDAIMIKESVNQHNSDSDNDDSDNNEHNEQKNGNAQHINAQIPTTRTASPTNTNANAPSTETESNQAVSPRSTSTTPILATNHSHFEPPLPSLCNNPSIPNIPSITSNPSMTNKPSIPNIPSMINNPSMIDSNPPHFHHFNKQFNNNAPPNQQRYRVIFPHDMTSLHPSLYIPQQNAHNLNMESNLDSNSEYNHGQSINTDSTNSTQSQMPINHHHNTTTNISITTNHHPTPHGIFMPAINPRPPITYQPNTQQPHSQPQGPPLPLPVQYMARHCRVPFPMPQPTNSTMTPPNNSSNTMNLYEYSQQQQQQQSNVNYGEEVEEEEESVSAEPQKTVNFQEIKAKGAPWHCPLCKNLSFDDWSDWKSHWYELHHDQYIGDQKSQKSKNKERIQQTVIPQPQKPFPPQPTSFMIQPIKNCKKRMHHQAIVTNIVKNDEFAPKAKRQKTSHLSCDNMIDHDVQSKDEQSTQNCMHNEEKLSTSESVSDSSVEIKKKNRKKKSKSSKKSKAECSKSIKKKKRSKKRERRSKKATEKEKSSKKRKRSRSSKKQQQQQQNNEEEGVNPYSSKSPRSKRQKIENENSPKLVVCKICHQSTTNNAGLSNHVKARHNIQSLDIYRALTQNELKKKQDEAKEIAAQKLKKMPKHRYKCTICKNVAKYCQNHVGLSSHLRAHVKAGDINDAQREKAYKEIVAHPVNAIRYDPIVIDDDDDDDEDEEENDCKDFKNEVVDTSSSEDEDNDIVTFKCPKISLPEEKLELSASTPICSSPSRSQSPNKINKQTNNDQDATRVLTPKISKNGGKGLSFDTNVNEKDNKNNDKKAKDGTASIKDAIGFGRIPKKTPEQIEQQRQEQLKKEKGNKKRRDFSPEPNKHGSNNENKSKYAHRNDRNAYDQRVRRSSSRSNSSHSNHSSHSSHGHGNNYRGHCRNERDSKYRTRDRSRNNSYHRNRSNNPMYPQKHNADNRNVPALAPLHSPKPKSSTRKSSQRHYYDNAKYDRNMDRFDGQKNVINATTPSSVLSSTSDER